MNHSWPEPIQELARQRYQQWQQKLPEPVVELDEKTELSIQRLLVISNYAFEWSLRQPRWLLKIYQGSDTGFESVFDLIQAEIEQLSDTDLTAFSEFEIKQWLRHQRHYYSMACAAFDLGQILSIRQVTYLQSLLANQLIMAAYHWLQQQFHRQYGYPCGQKKDKQQLIIMAMGKLGGMELNFSSDIDLIFCYPEDGETQALELMDTRTIECQKFFTRFAQKLVALLHETTADGFAYRVDMRLRPYGQSGALTLSFDAMADYYLEQGREWERFAMIKANLLAPSDNHKKLLENIIRPFSFRRYIDFSVLDAIRQLKQKITSEMRSHALAQDIKLGQGGIRELEFIVQSLQLISGGRYPELQQKNWWQSLAVLTEKELLITADAENLRFAYEFLRQLENRLQLRNNAQTQQLPATEAEQQIIAFSMGFEDWDSFYQALSEHRSKVESFFKQLFQDPNETAQANDQYQQIEYLLKDPQEFKAKSITGIHDEVLQQAIDFRQQFISDKLGQRSRKRANELLPSLVIEASRQVQPEKAMQRCLSILQSIGRRSAYFELLAENLPLLEHLVSLAARSSWLVEQLCLYPSLLDELLFPSNFGKILSKQDFHDQLRQTLLRIEPEQIEEQLLAIGRFKISSQFKVAAGLLNHRFEIDQVTRQLTDIAEIILNELLLIAWQDLCKKHGAPEGANFQQVKNFAVIGYGKLGGHELGFGSDLDLVFLYQGDSHAMTSGNKPIEVSQFYTRLGQRLVHYLNTRTQQGIMYEVDTRLRPSGRSGLLVSEFDSFQQYQTLEAWTWEQQALVRARPVAGDQKLMAAYEKSRLKLMASEQNLQQDIVAMRHKMRTNLDKTSDTHWDIKQGVGGLVDIEFLVQYWALLQAQLGKPLEQLYSNQYWLHWLQEQKIITSKIGSELEQAYLQLQTISNHKKLQHQASLLEQGELLELRQQVSRIWDSTFS